MSPKKAGRGLIILAAMAMLGSSAVGAENLDQGKPAPKLFAEGCASCHRSARGLAKGRFSFTLYLFLQKHYASGSSSAWALASYLQSIDSAEESKSRAAARPQATTTGMSRSSVRPPAPLPAR